MPSAKARLTHWVISLLYWRKRRYTRQQAIDFIVNEYEINNTPEIVPEFITASNHFTVDKEERSTTKNREIFHITPKEDTSDKVIIYWHGGAFITRHWEAVSYIAATLHIPVVLPIYTLLPLSTADECTQFAVDLILSISVDERYQGKEIVLMGDSAGGWVVMRVLERLCEMALDGDEEVTKVMRKMGKGVMFAPWVNLEVDDDLLQAAQNDWWLSPISLQVYRDVWIYGPAIISELVARLPSQFQDSLSPPIEPVTHPKYSPANGTAIFKRYIEANESVKPFQFLTFQGTADLLWPSVRRMHEELGKLGTGIAREKLIMEEGLFHVYPLVDLPESRKAWKRIEGFLSEGGDGQP